MPPDPEMAAAIPLQNPLNILLNDVEKELLVLGFQRPSSEKRSVGTFDFVPISAMNDIMRVLGCIECTIIPEIYLSKYYELMACRPAVSPATNHRPDPRGAPVRTFCRSS